MSGSKVKSCIDWAASGHALTFDEFFLEQSALGNLHPLDSTVVLANHYQHALKDLSTWFQIQQGAAGCLKYLQPLGHYSVLPGTEPVSGPTY